MENFEILINICEYGNSGNKYIELYYSASNKSVLEDFA